MSTQTESSVVIEGKNVAEALQAACDRLDTTPNQVDYEIVEEGRSGMLGFLKGKTVKIKVWEKSETERMISGLVKTLFAKMQMNVETRVSRGEDAYEIDLETSDSDGLLIGRGGDTLKSLQHLISRMVGHQDEDVRVRVDVAGYRKRRHEQLCRKAKDLADRALSSGRDMMTEPLPADERRIVHLTLADDNRVETRAVGEGQIKRVAVCAVGSRSERPQRGGRRGSGDRDRRPRQSNDRGDRSDSRDTRDRSDSRDTRDRSDSRDSRDRSDSRDDRPRGRQGEGEDRRPRGGRGGRDGGRDDRRPPRGDRRPERSRPAREEAPARAAEPRPAEQPAPAFEPNTSKPKRTIPIKESYFNIPDTIGGAKESTVEKKEITQEDAPLTFGRKRRPGRGRR